MANVTEVKGIGPDQAITLDKAGVRTPESLLERGSTSAGRKDLADATGFTEKQILEWVNRADLARVDGIGKEYANLLEEAGVDTIAELAQRNGANLYAKLVEVNEAKKIVRRMPQEADVASWVEQAKQLPRIVSY
jgi:predicted flap endonuclease-1-like 5' DNA nuclease